MVSSVSKGLFVVSVALAAGFGAIHCSSDREGFGDDTKDAEPPVTAPFVDASTPDAAQPELPLEDCSAENKQIYVLSQKQKELYRFDPEALTFTSIGRLQCPTAADTYSMAVDRRGTAWVEYQDGRIYNVSTKDASCVATSYRPGQLGFTNFGMGFAKDDAPADAGVTETLYLAGDTLGRLDLSTLEISLVGKDGPGHAELTGTGAGTLYAFLETGGRIVRLDKSNGTILETYRPSVEIGVAIAVAQWGGDFYVFTAPNVTTSTVTRYSPATNTSTVVMENAGMLVVGAGTSTCAPTSAPH